LFTANRQDRRLLASQGEQEASRGRRADTLRDLVRDLAALRARRNVLRSRLDLYTDDLLPLARQNVDAARLGLASDVVDYAEVVRAALAEIDLGIEHARIGWQLARNGAELAWLTGDADVEVAE